MIDPHIMEAFSGEIVKTAELSKKQKKALGLAAAGVLTAGAAGGVVARRRAMAGTGDALKKSVSKMKDIKVTVPEVDLPAIIAKNTAK